MKLLYSACQAASPKVSFPNKVVRTMLPDDFKISRLVTRKQGSSNANVKISAQMDEIDPMRNLFMEFHHKTKKWDAKVVEKRTGKRHLEILAAYLSLRKKYYPTVTI